MKKRNQKTMIKIMKDVILFFIKKYFLENMSFKIKPFLQVDKIKISILSC